MDLKEILPYWPMLSLFVVAPLTALLAYAAAQRVKDIARSIVHDEIKTLEESCSVSALRIDDLEQQVSQLTMQCFDREYHRRHFPENGRTIE